MIITGVLKSLMPYKRGENANGEWISREFCIKVEENGYSKDVAFICIGEKMVNVISQINVGTSIIVTFSPESRLRKDAMGWFTNLKCIGLQVAQKIV